jgi:hypothetical protein
VPGDEEHPDTSNGRTNDRNATFFTLYSAL